MRVPRANPNEVRRVSPERLFAPWRLEYILGEKENGCIFCKKPAEKREERKNLILDGSTRSFVIMNRYPYNPGHLMVVPRRHVSDLELLEAEEMADVSRLLQRTVRVLKETFRPEGLNLGLNLGEAAGAGIRDHLHWHIVPRWVGDTNFLPVFSNTRSIPQALDSTWEALRPGFEAAGRGGCDADSVQES